MMIMCCNMLSVYGLSKRRREGVGSPPATPSMENFRDPSILYVIFTKAHFRPKNSKKEKRLLR